MSALFSIGEPCASPHSRAALLAETCLAIEAALGQVGFRDLLAAGIPAAELPAVAGAAEAMLAIRRANAASHPLARRTAL